MINERTPHKRGVVTRGPNGFWCAAHAYSLARLAAFNERRMQSSMIIPRSRGTSLWKTALDLPLILLR